MKPQRRDRSIHLTGVFTALVTPFTEKGDLDEPALRKLVRRQVAGGVAGVVPCGTTGEAVTLDPDEHERVVAVTVEEARSARRADPRHRRLRLERHAEVAEARRALPEGGGRRAPRRHALLQQADADAASSSTSGRSPTRGTCRSSPTTSRGGPA